MFRDIKGCSNCKFTVEEGSNWLKITEEMPFRVKILLVVSILTNAVVQDHQEVQNVQVLCGGWQVRAKKTCHVSNSAEIVKLLFGIFTCRSSTALQV